MEMGIDIGGGVLNGFESTSKAVYFSYTHYFDLFGRTASILGALPLVDLETELDTQFGTFPGLSTRGLTDPFLQFNVGLIGQPARDQKEFFTSEPGFTMTWHNGIRLPFGEYDSDALLNAGSNRFEYRMGLPMSYIWGMPTQQTSIEVSPILYFFEDNDDPYGADRISQDPALQIEVHLVHDFLPALWGSLNALRVWGGETYTDGVATANPLDYTSIGASIGGRLSRHLGWSFSYGHRYNSKNEKDDGSLIRAGMTFTF
jgi:hypothetical protein